jgi:hypothetical protein
VIHDAETCHDAHCPTCGCDNPQCQCGTAAPSPSNVVTALAKPDSAGNDLEADGRAVLDGLRRFVANATAPEKWVAPYEIHHGLAQVRALLGYVDAILREREEIKARAIKLLQDEGCECVNEDGDPVRSDERGSAPPCWACVLEDEILVALIHPERGEKTS